MSTQPDVLFYHLTAQPLEVVLPSLLEKTLERGWRALVRLGSAERLAAMDTRLWTYSDDSFLPHGTPASPRPEAQPVYLTAGDENPNGADVLFLADGAQAEAFDGFSRVALLFDGADPLALAAARGEWRRVVGLGLKAVYWAQDEDGRWLKKAESGGDGRA